MFRKGCRVKTNSQLKGSDRKKLKSEILSQFSSISEEDINRLMPAKTPVSSIKMIINSGEVVIVYSAQKLPLIFEIDKVMYPTVYMLWEKPNLLHSFTTSELVSQKIMEGADLMVPGVFMDEPFINQGNIKKGEKVSINILTNKASIAVGKAAMSISEIIASGNRGKCVQVLHTYGDKLWSLERTVNLPRLGPVVQQGDNGLKIVSVINEQMKEISMEEQAKEIISEINSDSHSLSTVVPPCESDSVQSIPEDTPEQSTSAMDDLLMYSFFKSLLTSVKNVSMPLLANILYKVHILEACPAGMVLELKETKYKKLSNFLNEMADCKVIRLESATKGVLSISSVDYSHIRLKEFLSNHPEIKQVKENAKKQDVLLGPEISEKFTVTAAVLPLFSKYMFKKGDAVTTQDARKVITQYVRGENLQNPECKQEVILDNLLCSILCIRENRVTWENLVKIIISKMGQCYQVGLPSHQTISAKGKLPLIDLQVATRSGSKKVTLVNNLELYGVNLQEFSRECQHGVAASTTINIIPGAKSAQVQIQGNQILFVSKLLTEQYRIPKRYIRGIDDLTKKQK